MNAPVGIAGTPQIGISVNTPIGYTQHPVTGAVQQQQDVQRPASGAEPVQRNVPLSQEVPQIQPPPVQQINPLTAGRQSSATGYPLSAVQQVQPPIAERQSPAETPPPLRIHNIAELKEALVQHLLIEHTMLSAAVAKTLNWFERDGVLYMSVHTPFEVQQLQREKNILTRKTAELYGKELKIQITLAQEETVQKLSVPARVEMVLRNIKGSIVDIQKKAVAEEPEEE
ncbi:hypothetical protein HMPREF9195_01681 [Treponema medium ATCC 700293]|uniref:Uncharacterized protein n=1 Tax=Treponema medium ATCC 700293 TaxID=1125700 RepID=A0AA87TEP7_TREMD|nr:hypothetical protein [Treponema medium]EPF28469.1 hypothetical protein HMPREF9195_01681 [Treponema medium ATCC 700293]